MATKAADGKRPYLFRSPSLNFSEKTSEIGKSPPRHQKRLRSIDNLEAQYEALKPQ